MLKTVGYGGKYYAFDSANQCKTHQKTDTYSPNQLSIKKIINTNSPGLAKYPVVVFLHNYEENLNKKAALLKTAYLLKPSVFEKWN